MTNPIDPRPVGLCLTHERDARVPGFRSGKISVRDESQTKAWKMVEKLMDEGHTIAEIGRKLGMPESTVNYRIKRIKGLR